MLPCRIRACEDLAANWTVTIDSCGRVRAVCTFLFFLSFLANPAVAADLNKELYDAAMVGDADRVRKLLDSGANPNNADKAGVTLLMQASHKGHDDVIQVLIRAGAKLDTRDKNGYTALHRAAEAGSPEAVN